MNQVSKWALSALPIYLLFASPSGMAVICKSIDEHGVVSYTDTPVSGCAQPIQLGGHRGQLARDAAHKSDPATGSSAHSESDGQTFAGYASVRIVQPAEGAVIQSDDGRVPLQISLTPKLQKGHRIQLILDDQPIGSTLASTDMVLSGIEYGTHRLTAQVLNAKGGILGSMNTVTFTLSQKALADRQ